MGFTEEEKEWQRKVAQVNSGLTIKADALKILFNIKKSPHLGDTWLAQQKVIEPVRTGYWRIS